MALSLERAFGKRQAKELARSMSNVVEMDRWKRAGLIEVAEEILDLVKEDKIVEISLVMIRKDGPSEVIFARTTGPVDYWRVAGLMSHASRVATELAAAPAEEEEW
jgi:hypothetical protein